MTPAVPPLPTIWNLPFQPSLGIHTSNWTAGVVTPTTRQIGAAIVPTGFGFAPAGSISVSVIVVSAMLSLVLRSAQAMGFAASAGVAASAPAASNSAFRSFMIAPLFFAPGSANLPADLAAGRDSGVDVRVGHTGASGGERLLEGGCGRLLTSPAVPAE